MALLSFHSCPRGKPGTRDTGGMQVYVGELARALSRRGHFVDIFTRSHPGRHPEVTWLGPRARLVHIPDGIPETPKAQLHAHIGRFRKGVESFRVSSGMTYDLIHSHYWLSGLAGQTLSQSWRVPHLVTFHTLGAAKDRTGMGPPESRMRLRSECRVAGTCSRIIASTKREQYDLKTNCQPHPAPVAVVPCGCNLRLFKPVDQVEARARLGLGKDKVILSVGRLDPVKGQDLLLEAFSLLSQANARLLLVGGDNDDIRGRERLERLADDLGIRDRVIFKKAVPQALLKFYYNAADICVISSYYETFSMVALEALACGTPLAATDVGGIKLLLDHHTSAGQVAASPTPRALSEAMSRALAGQGGERERSARRALISDYDWPRIAEQTLRQYQAAMEEPIL
jgi:D-inositol-3-phosphate glycosyltransferase